MENTSILINTARGGLGDELALITALREGWIAGAALDVFEEEPLSQDNPLRSLENVYLPPHNANAQFIRC
jgi:phosphoglycerate dehydrogenase-like enzyme